VAANPYVTVLGKPETASSRLNLTQAFNSLGTFLAPFFGGLFIFRGVFTYSRWVFPKIEIQSEASPPLRHRAVWAAIMIAVFSAAIWDGIKALLGNFP